MILREGQLSGIICLGLESIFDLFCVAHLVYLVGTSSCGSCWHTWRSKLAAKHKLSWANMRTDSSKGECLLITRQIGNCEGDSKTYTSTWIMATATCPWGATGKYLTIQLDLSNRARQKALKQTTANMRLWREAARIFHGLVAATKQKPASYLSKSRRGRPTTVSEIIILVFSFRSNDCWVMWVHITSWRRKPSVRAHQWLLNWIT